MFVPHPTAEDFPAIMGQLAESPAEKSWPRGLGDMVAAGLSSIGITKERVEAFVGGPCGCPERQAAMNAAGAKWLGLPPGTTAPAEVAVASKNVEKPQ